MHAQLLATLFAGCTVTALWVHGAETTARTVAGDLCWERCQFACCTERNAHYLLIRLCAEHEFRSCKYGEGTNHGIDMTTALVDIAHSVYKEP